MNNLLSASNTMDEESLVEDPERMEDDDGLDLEQTPDTQSSVYPLNMSLNDTVSDRGQFTVYELKRKLEKKPPAIIQDPDFQRNNVWSEKQKAELIESVLMGLPLPIFYFSQTSKGVLIVVDGRQRLAALFEYLSDEFALKKLNILKNLNGKKFSDLDPIFQTKIEDYQLIAHIIKPSVPDSVKLDIFNRVNRGGTRLNAQEIRNALYQGPATKLLHDVVSSKTFEIATDKTFSRNKINRMKDRHIVLRFLAFYLSSKNLLRDEKTDKEILFENDIVYALEQTMKMLNRIPQEQVDSFYQDIMYALENTNFYLGENAFRLMKEEDGKLHKFPLNINIFESIMLMMLELPKKNEQIRESVKEHIDAMKYSEEFQQTLDKNRDSKTRIEQRIKLIHDVLNQI